MPTLPALPVPTSLALAGRIADQTASAHRFTDYLARKAAQTRRRQAADLALFARYLSEAGAAGELQAAAQAMAQAEPAGGRSLPLDSHHLIAWYLQHSPAGWRDLTWGLVEGFVRWQLQQGFAVTSVNIRLSTVKTFARLAYQAGSLNDTQYALIRTVSGPTLSPSRPPRPAS
jgi:hypothetical protein